MAIEFECVISQRLFQLSAFQFKGECGGMFTSSSMYSPLLDFSEIMSHYLKGTRLIVGFEVSDE